MLDQMNAKQGLDSNFAVVHSFSDEEIKDAQYGDPDLSRFLKTFHEHTEKPLDGILYGVSKTSVDPWRFVIPRSIQTKILEMLHNSK